MLLGGEPADSFDAVICRANLYGDWHHRPFTGWEERLERLQSISAVLGPRMFDPAEVWFAGYSKFLTAQKLAAAGLPAPPTRSATSMADVAAAVAEWGPTVVKPSFGLRAMDVERVTDPADPAAVALVERLLDSYGALLCTPYYPTEFGEFRITVAGEAHPIDMLKLPAYGSWRVKTLEGATFERLDTPPELADLALRATRAMGHDAGRARHPADHGRLRRARGQPGRRVPQHLRRRTAVGDLRRRLRLDREARRLRITGRG